MTEDYKMPGQLNKYGLFDLLCNCFDLLLIVNIALFTFCL